MSLTTWNFYGDTKGNGGDATTVAKALRNHYGIPLQKLQDEATIEAIDDPKEFIKKRQLVIDGLFNEKSPLTVAYTTAFNHYNSELKLPEAESAQLAFKATDSLYKANVEALELRFPGAYEKAMGQAGIIHKAGMAIAGNADPEFEKEAKARAFYKTKYKTKYGKQDL